MANSTPIRCPHSPPTSPRSIRGCRKARCAAIFWRTPTKENVKVLRIPSFGFDFSKEWEGMPPKWRKRFRFLKYATWWRHSALWQLKRLAAAFGALFAYESQVPRIASEKLSGLKQHYCADDRTCAYFALHRVADIHHSNVWRRIISALVEQDERHAEEALQGVSRAARALWTASDGIERGISALAN
jgi:hypothetical protein